MASKNKQKYTGFSSLSIYRVADEEIGKLKNNRIHYTYQNGPKKIDNNKSKNPNIYQSEITNNKYYINEYKNINKEKNSRNKSAIKIQHNSVGGKLGKGEGEPKNHKKNILRINNVNVSKDKDKNSSNKKNNYTYKAKQIKKKNIEYIDRIIIDLVTSNNEDNETNKSESKNSDTQNNINVNNSINNKDNNNEINIYENIQNKNNNLKNMKINKKDDLEASLDIIKKRWKKDCKQCHEFNFPPLLYNEIEIKKKEIEKIINKWENQNNIAKEINFFIEEKKNIKENENKKEEEKEKEKEKEEDINNINNFKIKWDNIQIKNENFFTIKNKLDKDSFLYSEQNYIKDLTKNIYIPKNEENYFCVLNNDNFIDDFNKIDYKLIKPKDKNQLELDLSNYYNEKKENYLKNKDNNDELKVIPIYLLNDKQIKLLYEELYCDIKMNKNKNEYLNSQLSVAKQTAIDYEIIEIYTPKNTNIDNNSNNNSHNSLSKKSIIIDNLKNDKMSESNNEIKKKSSQEFGQYTPISMLNEKIGSYVGSGYNKYSIPERQINFSFNNSNYNSYNNYNNKYSNFKRAFDNDILKKNNFSLKVERFNAEDSSISSKNSSKRNNEKNNILDYSKYSNNSNKTMKNNKK